MIITFLYTTVLINEVTVLIVCDLHLCMTSRTGCLPILIQLLHGDASEIISTSFCTSSDSDSTHTTSLSRADPESRSRASAALHNIVHSHPDDKRLHRLINTPTTTPPILTTHT